MQATDKLRDGNSLIKRRNAEEDTGNENKLTVIEEIATIDNDEADYPTESSANEWALVPKQADLKINIQGGRDEHVDQADVPIVVHSQASRRGAGKESPLLQRGHQKIEWEGGWVREATGAIKEFESYWIGQEYLV